MPILAIRLRIALGAACLAIVPSAALAAEEDDVDSVPGLIATYTAGGRAIERIDPDIAFDWGTASPDPRLSPGPFLAHWTGGLLLRTESKIRFHAWLDGDVTVEIDGQVVLADRRRSPGWVTGEPVAIGFGEKPLRVSYRSPDRGGVLKLCWSSEAFPLEPIPEHLLLREGQQIHLNLLDRGRQAFDASRCTRCHRVEGAPSAPPAPALTRVTGALSPERIVQQILHPRRNAPHSRMPSVELTEDEAVSIAAFLLAQTDRPRLLEHRPPPSKDRDKQRRAGQVLFRSTGCLACHTVADFDETRPGEPRDFAGTLPSKVRIDLSDVGRKRSADWLDTWLAEPERLNPDHEMPVFALSPSERIAIVTYLAGLKTDDRISPLPDNANLEDLARIRRGKALVEAWRCAACHRIDGVLAPELPAIDLTLRPDDWQQSCLGKTADRNRRRPAYDVEYVEATITWLSAGGVGGPLSVDQRGRQILEQKRCLACHDRGTGRGFSALAGLVAQRDEALRGQSEGMIPPSLTAVGDKLLDRALAVAVAGEQPAPRLPWLHIRMPKFLHSDEERAALVGHFLAADRIPPGPVEKPAANGPDPSASPPSSEAPNEPVPDARLLLGTQLVGPKGFSCIACHEAGTYKPKNVSLATHGSNLTQMGGRLRKEYYLRWTRSPARIVPGMEMPSYQKPVPGVLDERIDAQLLATWDALNDPRFTPPTNPAAVEQLLTVAAGEPARIVRDVFMLPEGFGAAHVPPALAVGFESGHSALFDLGTLTLRQWTFGDFARQRTQGKSWFWDLAGNPVVPACSAASDFALHPRDQAGPAIGPKREFGTAGRLIDYQSEPSGGIRFRCETTFDAPGAAATVRIEERLAPWRSNDGKRTGFERSIIASGIPEGYDLSIASHGSARALGAANIRRIDRDDADAWRPAPVEDEPLSEGRERRQTRLADGRIRLRYEAALVPDSLSHPVPATPPLTPEPVTTVPGYDGVRLPLPRSIMPTAIAFTRDGRLAFASLKGHLYLARDTDGDGLPDALSLFEEGLSAPYGLVADGDSFIVAHKPELLRLRDTDGDGRADERTVVASGWGLSEDYHDWTCGIARDANGNLYVGTGSDYTGAKRPQEVSRWRGKVLRIAPGGTVTPIAHALRYPTGLAFDLDGRLFATDNQGVQNSFNELNHILEGRSYGVPARWEEGRDAGDTPAAVQIPHPWTRSVNGIAFLPKPAAGAVKTGEGTNPAAAFAGHGIGCEYDSRFLVRFSIQQAGDAVQGAVYPFSLPESGAGGANFTGPLSIAAESDGSLWIGSIHDSGWLGGLNTGDIVRLRPNGKLPNGIREARAVPGGFEIDFVSPLAPRAAGRPESYSISGYTRVWKGGYATPDSGRHTLTVDAAAVSPDARRVTLAVDGAKEGHIYEITCGKIGREDEPLFPATAHFTLHRAPK